jgi:hypothetical protein
LTGEHLVTAGVWEGVNGVERRDSRLKRKLDYRGGPRQLAYPTTVKKLIEDILCDHHNTSSNNLDDEAIKFRKALVAYHKTVIDRLGAPRRRLWPRIVHKIDGPKMQRWLIKTAINCAQHFDKPIGGAGPRPGQPTPELVEQVFGRRPVIPEQMFAVVKPGQEMAIEEEQFTLMYFDRGGPFLAGFILGFRSLWIGVQFDEVPTPEMFGDPSVGFEGGPTRPRFPGLMGARGARVRLQLDWPPQP